MCGNCLGRRGFDVQFGGQELEVFVIRAINAIMAILVTIDRRRGVLVSLGVRRSGTLDLACGLRGGVLLASISLGVFAVVGDGVYCLTATCRKLLVGVRTTGLSCDFVPFPTIFLLLLPDLAPGSFRRRARLFSSATMRLRSNVTSGVRVGTNDDDSRGHEKLNSGSHGSHDLGRLVIITIGGAAALA
jgi:hypothetical protein